MSSPASKMKYGTVLNVDGALIGITAESMADLERFCAKQGAVIDPGKVSMVQLQQIAEGNTESRFSKELNALMKASRKPLMMPAMAIAMKLAQPDGLVRYPGGFWNKPGLTSFEIKDAATTSTVIACADAGLLKFTRFHKREGVAHPVEAKPV